MSRSNDISYGEYAVKQQQRQERYDRRSRIKECIEACNIELERGKDENYVHAINIIRDYLWPLLVEQDTTQDFENYFHEFSGSDDYEFHWVETQMFSDNHEEYRAKLLNGDVDGLTKLQHHVDGELPPKRQARQTTDMAFETLEDIAEYEGIVSDSLTSNVPAYGFDQQLGFHHQQYDFDVGDEVRVVDDDKGALKTLYTGGTGAGKSSTMSSESGDRYNAGQKVLDLVDFKEGENVVQDIPQLREELRNIREEHGFAPDFHSDTEQKTPELEILVPLTQGLEEKELVYDTESEEFITKPFTIPLSEIPRDVMVALLSASATPQQESEIRQAYRTVEYDQDDYTLEDIAEEIRKRDTLEDKFKERIIQLLHSIHRMGFIRDREDPHAIELEEIMRETDTLTSVTQMHMETKSEKLMVVLCLLGMTQHIRESSRNLPRLTLVLRELHKVTPHSKRESFDAVASDIQSTIGTLLGEIFRENRHESIEVMADTQSIGDLKKNVRELFNRVVVFTPSACWDVADEVQAIRQSVAKPAAQAMRTKAGFGCVLGNAETINDNKSINFLAPIQFVPPAWHHLDTDKEPVGTGFERRVEYFDHEEYRIPEEDGVEWHTEVQGEIEKDRLMPDDIDRSDDPMRAFVDEIVDVTGDTVNDRIAKSRVRDAYEAYAEEYDLPPLHEDKSTFGDRLTDYDAIEKGRDSDNTYVYKGLQLTEEAIRLVDEH